MSPAAPLSFVVASLANGITAAAFLVRDMLWLRILSAAANAAFLVASLLSPTGLNALAGWTLLFLVINIYQIIDLVLERRKVDLADEDRDLHAAVFPNLQHGEFRLLLKIARRFEAPEGAVLVEQGQEAADVVLVERGAIELQRDTVLIERLQAGRMLGAVAFVAGRPFASRAVAATPVRLVVWEREQLNRLFERRPSIAIGFHAAFIGQMRPGEPVEAPREGPVFTPTKSRLPA